MSQKIKWERKEIWKREVKGKRNGRRWNHCIKEWEKSLIEHQSESYFCYAPKKWRKKLKTRKKGLKKTNLSSIMKREKNLIVHQRESYFCYVPKNTSYEIDVHNSNGLCSWHANEVPTSQTLYVTHTLLEPTGDAGIKKIIKAT